MEKKSYRYIIISILYGFFGALGFVSYLIYSSMAAFHERHLHPYAYPFSVISGLTAVICIIFLLAYNIFGIKSSVKTIIIGTIITAFSLCLFTLFWIGAIDIIGEIILKLGW